MWLDEKAGTLFFKLAKPGLMKAFEGKWTIRGCDPAQPLSALVASNRRAVQNLNPVLKPGSYALLILIQARALILTQASRLDRSTERPQLLISHRWRACSRCTNLDMRPTHSINRRDYRDHGREPPQQLQLQQSPSGGGLNGLSAQWSKGAASFANNLRGGFCAHVTNELRSIARTRIECVRVCQI